MGHFYVCEDAFCLTNVGATFQHAMDIAFAGEKGKFVVIYMDDIIVYSKFDREHIHHLEKVFIKCRKFSISLNPKKIKFHSRRWKVVGSHNFKGWNKD